MTGSSSSCRASRLVIRSAHRGLAIAAVKSSTRMPFRAGKAVSFVAPALATDPHGSAGPESQER